MKSYRKVERKNDNRWEEIKFKELKEGDLFTLADVYENGELIENASQIGGIIYKATTDAYQNDDGVYTVEIADKTIKKRKYDLYK